MIRLMSLGSVGKYRVFRFSRQNIKKCLTGGNYRRVEGVVRQEKAAERPCLSSFELFQKIHGPIPTKLRSIFMYDFCKEASNETLNGVLGDVRSPKAKILPVT